MRSSGAHNPLNGQKEKLQNKLPPPPPCEKGTLLLPNVGVPKILPDRKFPILRCILKSRSHPNAVTVTLLTLIAFLHPPVLHSVPLPFSHREHCTLSNVRSSVICWVTADNMSASSRDFVFQWEVIADSEAYSPTVTRATSCPKN